MTIEVVKLREYIKNAIETYRDKLKNSEGLVKTITTEKCRTRVLVQRESLKAGIDELEYLAENFNIDLSKKDE